MNNVLTLSAHPQLEGCFCSLGRERSQCGRIEDEDEDDLWLDAFTASWEEEEEEEKDGALAASHPFLLSLFPLPRALPHGTNRAT